MNKEILWILQIVVAVGLVVLILLQNRGNGLGRVWGFSGSSFTRRGLEKLVFKATFVLAALFLTISVLQFVL